MTLPPPPLLLRHCENGVVIGPLPEYTGRQTEQCVHRPEKPSTCQDFVCTITAVKGVHWRIFAR